MSSDSEKLMNQKSDSEKGKSSASLFSMNERAAQAFTEIAEYLELKGENPFKIKAYVKASRVLRDLSDDLQELQARGELRSIPGVGKAIADKLESFLETGSIPQLEELKREIPAGLVEIASLPGLGAKKTVLLHRELGVSSLLDLKAACLEDRVETVKGFSKKSQEKFLALVEKALSSEVAFVKSRLEEWAHQTLERLQGVAGLEEALLVGDVRRKCPFSDRLELLLSCRDEELARREVQARMGGAGVAVREQGDGFIVFHPSACPIHLIFCSSQEKAWKTLLHTGPANFVDELCKRGGISAPPLDCEERQIFSQAKLNFVPPELRERLDPWACRTELLEVGSVVGNLHAHTTWSDGKHSLEEMVSTAIAEGHQYFGVTDHSRSLVITNGLTIERLQAQGREIGELDARLKEIKVFRSVECDILEEGDLDYPLEVLQALDYVVVAVHSFFHLSPVEMTERLLKGVSHPLARIFAHPTGRKLPKRDGYVADWARVFEQCAESQVAVEINASPWRLDISEELLELALSKGCLISINTDAHSISEFGNLKHGVDMARRVALDPDRVINTWPLERLKAWFESGKLSP